MMNAMSTRKNSPTNFTNLYVNNFGPDMTETELCRLFAPYGRITSCKIPTDDNQNSKLFGYVNYENHRMAQMAIEQLNGHRLENGKQLYVGRFQRRAERSEMRTQQGSLYLSNLDLNIDEYFLHEIFNRFGKITHIHILRNDSISKGLAFVNFESTESALHALNEMNGKWLLSKPIYIKLSESNQHQRTPTPAYYYPRYPYPVQVFPVNFLPSTMLSPTMSYYSTIDRVSPIITRSTGPSPGKRTLYPYESVYNNDNDHQ